MIWCIQRKPFHNTFGKAHNNIFLLVGIKIIFVLECYMKKWASSDAFEN
ncbi:hypothetical protein HME9304_01511 [Flagellimonas maritima]|uniref:Uncharacterized protein n=1 Tax=Flagellimonas maritima TaxID=1383885 RepID=A0A2Z4LT30_9FLAO|nr:hypothetical protein HME9304_01511 [Allomuricauda aurantiaca]